MNELLARIRAARADLFTYVNTLGSIVLGYILTYPGAFDEFRAIAPEAVRPYLGMMAIAWFAIAQIAKARAVKKAVGE